jgi:hypothetical protein
MASETVRSPLGNCPKSASYQLPDWTAPNCPRSDPSIAGRVPQVIDSDHEFELIDHTRPPCGEASLL